LEQYPGIVAPRGFGRRAGAIAARSARGCVRRMDLRAFSGQAHVTTYTSYSASAACFMIRAPPSH